ncbi:hypothetical protein [Streptomyces sp. NPDC054834]
MRMIRPRDIGRDGTIATPSEETVWASIPADLQLAPGDLVILRLIAPVTMPPHGFFTAEVTYEHLPAAASDNVVVLRPAKPLSRPRAP